MTEEFEYAVAETINFPLVDFGATDFESTPVTFAAGDVQISIDDGAFANTTNLPAHEGNGIYSLALTAAEITGRKMVVTIIDQTDPKLWEDQAVLIRTFGNAAGFYLFNRNEDVAVQVWAELLEGSLTAKAIMRLIAAGDAGETSGMGTASAVIRSAVDNLKTRISGTVDASGNRTGITLDVTDV